MRRVVAGVRVGLLPDLGLVVNPTVAQMEESTLDLIIAGTSEAVLMIEGFCSFLTEEQMLEVSCAASPAHAGLGMQSSSHAIPMPLLCHCHGFATFAALLCALCAACSPAHPCACTPSDEKLVLRL
jgi:hypothetical protein